MSPCSPNRDESCSPLTGSSRSSLIRHKSDYVRMEEARSIAGPPRKPCIATSHEFTPFQLRLLFRRIEIFEKNSAKVPVITFRRCFRRVLDMFDPRADFDLEEFGCHEGCSKMSWQDVRIAIDRGVVPKIQLSLPQVIFLALEDFTTSHIATIWYCLTNLAIVVNISVMILQSLDGYSETTKGYFAFSTDCCISLFVFDYFAKAITVVWCPIALYDEVWMFDHALPSGDKEYLITHSLHTTKLQRLFYWATCARNLIDFFSILPNMLSLVMSGMHLPLSPLRMLRLLRVVRILRAFKAVGKWVTTLQTLGEAFFSSMGAVFVLVLYMAVFALVTGAVLYELEHSGGSHFVDVPTAMKFVTERFVGKSLSVASSMTGAAVLAGVGMFKGIIFLLPIDKLKKATKASADRFQQMSTFKDQVERETLVRSLPKGIAWASDFNCPTARFEVFDGGAEDGERHPSVGTAHIPLFEMQPTEVVLLVPLHGGAATRAFGAKPELEVLVTWTPAMENRKKRDPPKGDLALKVLSGVNFASAVGSRWQVRMYVPETIYGDTANTTFLTSRSLAATATPTWGDHAQGFFTIAWEAKDEEKHQETQAEAFRRQVLAALEPDPEDEGFEEKVLGLLELQSKRIAELEEKIREAVKPRPKPTPPAPAPTAAPKAPGGSGVAALMAPLRRKR